MCMYRLTEVCNWLKWQMYNESETSSWISWLPRYIEIDCSLYNDGHLDLIKTIRKHKINKKNKDNYDLANYKKKKIKCYESAF